MLLRVCAAQVFFNCPWLAGRAEQATDFLRRQGRALGPLGEHLAAQVRVVRLINPFNF
jgi:hypothetical protein